MNELLRKKHMHMRHNFTIFIIMCAFFIIITTLMINIPKKLKGNNVESGSQVIDSKVVDKNTSEVQFLSVLKKVDTVNKTMTMLNVVNGQDITLSYTGGTFILDKYEQHMVPTQLTIGEMLDVYYNEESEKLIKVQISQVTWDYKGVNHWNIDTLNQIIKIADNPYRYSSHVFCFGNGQVLDLSDLSEKDEVTIKGKDKHIWSIVVTKGHGTIQLTDYEDFYGGIAYIGNKQVLPVESDMEITVQEGNYNVSLEKGKLKGNKAVKVEPYKSVVVSMAEFKIKKGFVVFETYPQEASLYINDKLYDINEPIELEYGQYKIKVELLGYTSYIDTIKVEEENKIISIQLVEDKEESDIDNSDEGNMNPEEDPVDGPNNEIDGNESENNETNDNESNNNETNDIGNQNKPIIKKNYIYIEGPQDASIYFNGEFKGVVPVSFPKIIGTNYITVIMSDNSPKTYTVLVEDDGLDVSLDFTNKSVSE